MPSGGATRYSILKCLNLVSFRKSPSSHRLAEAGFNRNYKVYDGNRFVLTATVALFQTKSW